MPEQVCKVYIQWVTYDLNLRGFVIILTKIKRRYGFEMTLRYK